MRKEFGYICVKYGVDDVHWSIFVFSGRRDAQGYTWTNTCLRWALGSREIVFMASTKQYGQSCAAWIGLFRRNSSAGTLFLKSSLMVYCNWRVGEVCSVNMHCSRHLWDAVKLFCCRTQPKEIWTQIFQKMQTRTAEEVPRGIPKFCLIWLI